MLSFYINNMSSNSKRDSVVISYDKFNVENMSCTELKEGIGSKGPKIAFPEFYNNGVNQPILLQFPWINISQGGVSRIGGHIETDEDRKNAGVKIPLDESIPESAKLLQVMRDFDKKCNSESFRMKLLGKYYKKYNYLPVVKNDIKNNEDEDEDDIIEPSTGPKYHPSLKLKLETDYQTGEITTKLYIDKDNTRNWVEQTINDINDFSNIFCYRSDVHVIIKVAKFWVHPITKQNPQWGATFKLIKAQVRPPNSIINNPSAADFLNSDEESEENPKSSKKVVVKSDSNEEENEEEKLQPIATKKVAQVETDDDESEEESSKEKLLPTPPPPTPTPPSSISTKTTKKVAQVESDDDESEEKPSSPIVTKKIAQVESDDDSDDNEEPEPPPIKKQVAKKVAKVESDDDSDDDEEPEPPPIKKPVAKKVAKVESDDDEEPEPPPIKKPVAKNTGGRGGKSKSS